MMHEESEKIVHSDTQKIQKYSSNAVRRGLDLANRITAIKTTTKTDVSKLQTQFWKCIYTVTHPCKSITSAVLSSNGQILALVDRWGIINIWDLKNEKLLNKPFFCHRKEQPSPGEHFYETNLALYNTFEKYGSTFRLQFTSDNQALVSIGQQEVKFWDLGSGHLTQFLSKVCDSSIDLEKESVVYSNYSEQIKVWNFRNKKILYTLDSEFTTIEYIALSSDSKFVAASGYNLIGGNWDKNEYINEHSIKIFSLPTGELLHIVNKYIDTENIKESPSISIDPSSQFLISIEAVWEDNHDESYVAKIWDLQAGELLHTLELGSNHITFTKDKNIIACSTDNRVINIWNLATGELLKTLVGHDDTVNCFAISSDSQTLISGSKDEIIIVWDLKTGNLLHKLEENRSPVHSIEMSLDGKMFVSIDGNCKLTVWKLSQYKYDKDLQEPHNFEFNLVSEELLGENCEELFKNGLDKYNQGSYREAFDDFNQVLTYDPNNGYAYIYRGSTRSVLGDQQGTIEDYTQVLNINSNYAEVYNDRGLIRVKLGDYSGAIEDYTQALRIDSNLWVAHFNRASGYSELGNYSEAIEDYNQVLQIHANYEIYILRGCVHLKQGNYSAALEDFEKALQIAPESANIHINKMNDALSKQDMESVMQPIVQHLITQGNMRYISGDYIGAIETYTQVLNIEPDSTEAYNRRSTARSALGDYQGAIEDLQQAINPSSVKITDYKLLDYLRLVTQIMREN